MDYQQFLEISWRDYIENTPSAKNILNLLQSEGETVENDHIAFRTWSHNDKVSLEQFKRPFLDWGLIEMGQYFFKNKKVQAIHLEHPTNKSIPKVFISEILWKEFSPEFQKIMNKTLESIPGDQSIFDLFKQKVCWVQKVEEFEVLAQESEYGAWLYAWGIRPNHFTVNINSLKKFPTIESLNQWLKNHGFSLNSSGGEVKGSAQIFLEQSSIMADMVNLKFSNGTKNIPSCYYEFAKRYIDQSGLLYQGFHEASADKIFESTNARR